MAEQFLKECKEVRNDFVKVAGTYDISNHLELRTEIDSLLIMYDQLCERVRLANAGTSENNALLPDVSGSASKNELILQLIEKIETEKGNQIKEYENTMLCGKGKITITINID